MPNLPHPWHASAQLNSQNCTLAIAVAILVIVVGVIAVAVVAVAVATVACIVVVIIVVAVMSRGRGCSHKMFMQQRKMFEDITDTTTYVTRCFCHNQVSATVKCYKSFL